MLNTCRADPKHISDTVLRCVDVHPNVGLGRGTPFFKVEGLKLSLRIFSFRQAQVRVYVFDLGGKFAE